jgi:hypothetical protein
MLSYQLGSCITAEGTAGSPSPPRGRRAVCKSPADLSGVIVENL